MFQNIPDELKAYKSWVVWIGEKKENGKVSKPPYQVRNGYKADVTNPEHWATFEEALAIVNAGHADGLSFCLSRNDPYSIIDFDDASDNQDEFERQLKIYNNLNSYSEVSPSGRGLHIVTKGSILQGVRRGKIEIYSDARHMSFTGNRYNNEPIKDCQNLLNILWEEMQVPVYNFEAKDSPQNDEDKEILDRAYKAANGDKFERLMKGDWQNYYQSQSEADFALIDIFGFYTQNVNQVKRLWTMSALSLRNKQTSIRGIPYLDHMIARSFDRQMPLIDLTALKVNGQTIKQVGVASGENATPTVHAEVASSAQTHPGMSDGEVEANPTSSAQAANLIARQLAVKIELPNPPPVWPPGLLGAVADTIYNMAARPCYEVALTGAIAFMAGICGRAFNISGTGLNQYILLLGMTGINKEAARKGAAKIRSALKVLNPNIGGFFGPGDIKSDAGLVRWISENPCFVSYVGEFGIRFSQLTAERANSNDIGIRRILLDLYNNSGKGSILDALAYSDKTKNTASVDGPAFSMFGEGIPETFYSSLSEDIIMDGLLPRFLTIEYKGGAIPLSKTFNSYEIDKNFISHLNNLVSQCQSLNQNNAVTQVQISQKAQEILDDLEIRTNQILNNSKEVKRQLWNRANVKSMKLAALVAIGLNPWNPIVDEDSLSWALSLVEKDIKNISSKFDLGEVGVESKITYASDDNQLKETVKMIGRFVKKEIIPEYGMTDKMLIDGVYTFSALSQRVSSLSCFRRDKLNSTAAFKRAMQNLLDSGDIQEMPMNQAEKEYGKRAKCFVVKNYARFV